MGHGHLDLLLEMELACRDDNLSLDALIVMANHLDNLLRERRYSHRFSPSLSEHSGSEPEPMEVCIVVKEDTSSSGPCIDYRGLN